MNYDVAGSDGGDADCWADYGNTVLDTAGLDKTKAIVERLRKKALKEFLGDIEGTALLVGLSDGLGVLASSRSISSSGCWRRRPPKPIQEDVLVVSTKKYFTLEQQILPMEFTSNDENLSGIGLEFSIGTGSIKSVYAQIFIDPNTTRLSVSRTNPTARRIYWAISSIQNSLLHPAEPDELYALYPDASDAAKTALKAPANTQFQVFGAFFPVLISNPGEKTFFPGSNYSDLLNANKTVVKPEACSNDSTKVTTGGTTMFGFAGADLLYRSAGADTLDGGDGDDSLFAFITSWTTRETLSGDDLLSARATKTDDGGNNYAGFDSGAGTDTVTFQYSSVAVTWSLPAPSAKAVGC